MGAHELSVRWDVRSAPTCDPLLPEEPAGPEPGGFDLLALPLDGGIFTRSRTPVDLVTVGCRLVSVTALQTHSPLCFSSHGLASEAIHVSDVTLGERRAAGLCREYSEGALTLAGVFP
jgi:hypothetical protein